MFRRFAGPSAMSRKEQAMTRHLRLMLFLCMIIAGVGLCDLSLAQIDIPTRAATEEAFDPAAPDPGTNGVEIPPDPGQDPSQDSSDAAPDDSDAATEVPTAPPAPTATATNTPVVRPPVAGAPTTTSVPP